MKARLAAAVGIFLLGAMPAAAHRLDEYLQATTISVEKDYVQAQIRLTPGVAVFPIVLANIDTDADGLISEAEQRTYAERVVRDLSLTIDGDPLLLQLVSFKFAKIDEMKEGLGDIQLEFIADVPRGGTNRKLIFENQHQSRIAAYLVNVLVPRDPTIRVTAQNRDYRQSFYQLNYVQAHDRSNWLSFSWWSGVRGLLASFALLLFAWPALLWRRRARAASQK